MFLKSISFTSVIMLVIIGITLITCDQTQQVTTSDTPPEISRFTTTIVTQPGAFDEPMAFTFTDEENIIIVERKGGVKHFDTKSREVELITTIPVNTKYVNAEGESREAEEGLMGVVADPNFSTNHWIYLFYADPDTPKHLLTRWELDNDQLDPDSKKVLLSFPTQRELCCHTGGGMVFDKDGNLYLTTGNNTANPPQGTSNLDERPGRKHHDDQRTAGNTNDLRGKILRIHPEADGSYSIPEGNLFPPGTEKARPEIYTMGHRNPWRVSVDNKTGYIYWGEVGPDASRDSTIGPRGYDEFNQARQAGFFGWPYFIGDNKAYADYDYTTGEIKGYFDTAHVINDSPNNTGLTELPKPQKAFIWYPYSNSEEFPLVGSSGRSATGGPIFRLADFAESDQRFPPYYEGKWLMVEFMRGWIMSVTMNEKGDFESMERFLPDEDFQSAIDIKFSPNGDLYVLEYGSAWFRGNANAQLKRIEYNGGNRIPVVVANADKIAGAVPLSVQFTSQGTTDYDNDPLQYTWNIHSENGYNRTLSESDPNVTFDKKGNYQVTLTVRDGNGGSNSQSFDIQAGNEPPQVNIEITKGNQSFFFPGATLEYEASVEDREDGSLENGIDWNQVSLNFDYAPEGFDPIEIAQNHRASDDWTTFSKGGVLVNQNDCRSCHLNDRKSVGPSYQEVAARYKNNPAQQQMLAKKIITGGTGVWGEHAMSAHPQLSEADALLMVNYIMSLADQPVKGRNYSPRGSLTTDIPPGDNGHGSYLMRVAYTDQGNEPIGPLTSEKIIALRNPVLNPEKYDEAKGNRLLTTPSRSFSMVGDQSYIAFDDIDLTGIKNIEIFGEAPPRENATGCTVEIHLDTPNGQLISTQGEIEARDNNYREIVRNMKAENTKKGKPEEEIDYDQARRLAYSVVNANVENIEGIHKIYFVFRNPRAEQDQVLTRLFSIEFRSDNEVL